jgi:hypothetical protein
LAPALQKVSASERSSVAVFNSQCWIPISIHSLDLRLVVSITVSDCVQTIYLNCVSISTQNWSVPQFFGGLGWDKSLRPSCSQTSEGEKYSECFFTCWIFTCWISKLVGSH